MRPCTRRLSALLVLTVCAGPGCTLVTDARRELRDADAPPDVVTPEEVARAEIRPRDVDRHVNFLASDERRGRGTPSEGLVRTAAWIATQFQRMGLEPAGDSSGFLQYWPYRHGAPSAAGPAPGAGFAAIPPADRPAADSAAVRVPNVVARLPGSDLTQARSPVIVLAHYDHLGVGEPNESGDSIYNGADDNASGVAALVTVARAFAALPQPPRRPVVFLAVAGSEPGLLGATWYADHATVELEQAVAVLNLDTVGRNHRDSIGVVGYGLSTLGPLVEEVAARREVGLTVVPDLVADRDGFRRSDHFPFARRGIPAIQLFSGLHPDYHTPDDEADRVDDHKVSRVARLAFFTALRLASGEIRPEWTEAGRAHVRR